MRGGAQEPLTSAEINEKFAMCCRYGGWDTARAAAGLALSRRLFDTRKVDLSELRG
jgi:hypothetical protein